MFVAGLVAAGVAPLATLRAQSGTQPALRLETGAEIYKAGCVACHGGDGRGTSQNIAGFEKPDTFPDFTDCPTSTPETNTQWKAVIKEGGKARGFSDIMPSFGEALTDAQIDKVIAYLRSLCRNPHWARGELNLPRALGTEKAFPENENVISSGVNVRGAPGVSTSIIHEHRFGMKNQIELELPLEFQHPDRTWYGGVGDALFGFKREMYSNLRSGSIFSLQGEVALSTGNSARGLGAGTTTFGTFAAFGQLLPRNSFLQFQSGADLPVDTSKASQLVFWNTALGKTFAQDRGLGRMWSPMIELLGERELTTGARTNWDLLPEMQVTLSRRQHVRGDLGVRFPVNNTRGRSVQLVFYLLWDWGDGKVTEGW
jgi:mono/diheme cytochrome c family protein